MSLGHEPTTTQPAPGRPRHDDLRRDVRARPGHRVRQPGPGLPRPGRAGQDRPGRRRRDPGRPRQPVPAGTRRAGAAPGHRGPRRAVLRPWLRPGQRDPGHRGRHRGDRGGHARPGRAGRRGDRVRALLRLLRGQHRHGRRRPRAGHAAPAGLPPRPDRAHPSHHSDRTRLILLNSPHNPTGTVFSRDELAAIAALAVERDLLVVTDEVYEHLVFDGEHVPIVQFPGMRERTVSVSARRARRSPSPAGRSAGSRPRPSW